jgi:hypothetical protein
LINYIIDSGVLALRNTGKMDYTAKGLLLLVLNQFEILCGDFKYDLLETKNRNYTKKIIDSYFTPYMPYLRQNPPLNQSAIESQPLSL